MDGSKAVKKRSQLYNEADFTNVKVEAFKWICLVGAENLVLQHGEDVGCHLSKGRLDAMAVCGTWCTMGICSTCASFTIFFTFPNWPQ